MSKKSFEMLIRRRFRIWISKEFLPVNEVRRAYYHKWEERIVAVKNIIPWENSQFVTRIDKFFIAFKLEKKKNNSTVKPRYTDTHLIRMPH